MTTSVKQQSPVQIMFRKMEAMRFIFQKVVRIMSGKPIRVILESGPPFPGWTDGQDIYLNRDLIEAELSDPNFTDARFFELVMRLWGVVYHEMGHIQGTPRAKDAGSVTAKAMDMTRQHSDRSWWYSVNALEDQRIETGFTARYRPTGKFFEAAVLEWLMRSPENAAKAHLLLHGRLYLPPKVRQVAQAAFVAKYGAKLAKQAEDVIEDYLPLVFPRDDIKGWQCVERFQAIVKLVMPDPSDLMSQPSEDNDPRCTQGDPSGRQSHQIKKGRQSSKSQEDAAEEMQDIDWDADRDADDDTDEYDGEGEDEMDGDEVDDQSGDDGSEDGEPCDDGSDGGSAATDSEGEGDELSDGDAIPGGTSGDSDGDDSDADDSSDDWGSGSGDPSVPDLDSALEELQQQVQEALDDAIDEIAVDVDDVIDDIYEQMRRDDGLAGNMATASQDVSVEPVTTAASARCVEAINRLRMDLEAQKVQRQMAGRLNVRRALMVQDHQLDVFDRWDVIGEEVGGLEVAICVDLSISMGEIMGLVSRILWALKHAFDQLQIRCTVLGFSDDWVVLYRPGELTDPANYRLFGDIGGTMPLECLREAVSLLTQSETQNRALVTVTDGAWGPYDIDTDGTLEPLMRHFHQAGGNSLLVGLDHAIYGDPNDIYNSEGNGLHHHLAGKDIDSIEQLPDAVMSLVESMLKRAIALNMPV